MAEAGDFAAFDVDVAACEALARRLHDATWLSTSLVHRAMRATMQGRFAEAEALGDEAVGIGARSQHEVAAAVYYAHLLSLRAWQGRLAELLPVVLDAAGRHTELPAVWAALPYAHAELGRRDEAADELRRGGRGPRAGGHPGCPVMARGARHAGPRRRGHGRRRGRRPRPAAARSAQEHGEIELATGGGRVEVLAGGLDPYETRSCPWPGAGCCRVEEDLWGRP